MLLLIVDNWYLICVVGDCYLIIWIHVVKYFYVWYNLTFSHDPIWLKNISMALHNHILTLTLVSKSKNVCEFLLSNNVNSHVDIFCTFRPSDSLSIEWLWTLICYQQTIVSLSLVFLYFFVQWVAATRIMKMDPAHKVIHS